MYVVRDYLIQKGYVLIADASEAEDAPVFVLAGYEGNPNVVQNLPALLLSSSGVYGDRDHLLILREPVPMDEANGSVITSPLDPSAGPVLDALVAEWRFLNRPGRTIVVRPFNVFGPGVTTGVVHEFVTALREGRPLEVHSPGRQSRTFLFVDDFLDAIGALVERLNRGSRGIYNVGSSDPVEILSLAKSIGHAFGVEPDIQIVETTKRHQWWKLPALDRIRASAKWRAHTSLRAALFRMAGK